MAAIKSYRDLIVWQKSMSLVTEVYHVSDSFPSSEDFSLTAHVRKTAVSVPSNIAEGFGRGSAIDYVRFLKIARGSVYELQTQLEIAVNLGYLKHDSFENFEQVVNEIERMLNSLIAKVQGSG